MLRGISAKQYIELRAFDELEPFGEIRADYRAASIVSTLVNLRRNVDRYPDPFPIRDFLVLWGDDLTAQVERKKKGRPWQELKAMGQFLAAMYNAAEEEPRGRRKQKKR